MPALNFNDIWNVFLPIIKFFLGLWEFFNTGVYDAFTSLLVQIPLLGQIYKPIVDTISSYTGFDEWLNQFTVLTITIGGGLIVVIVLTIVGFFTDKVGL